MSPNIDEEKAFFSKATKDTLHTPACSLTGFIVGKNDLKSHKEVIYEPILWAMLIAVNVYGMKIAKKWDFLERFSLDFDLFQLENFDRD